MGGERRNQPPVWAAIADRFRQAEHLMYVVVGSTLAVAGFVLFGQVLYDFGHGLTVDDRPLAEGLLDAVNGILLVFIFAELLHTVRAVIAEDVLKTEPFLVIAIVAAVRRFIVASAEASEVVGGSHFDDLMVELGVLVGAVLVLALSIWLLRHSSRMSPGPDVDTDDSVE